MSIDARRIKRRASVVLALVALLAHGASTEANAGHDPAAFTSIAALHG